MVGVADASVLISKFKKSLENTRRRLDFAISPFLRLVPSSLVVEVEDLDMPGYNNMIKEGDDPGVHCGFNSAIIPRARSVGTKDSSNRRLASSPFFEPSCLATRTRLVERVSEEHVSRRWSHHRDYRCAA